MTEVGKPDIVEAVDSTGDEEDGWIGWVPLEANENALNKYLNELGISGVKCEEIWSFDDHIPFIETPHYALILCYSHFTQVKKVMDANYSAAKAEIPEGVFFAQQKIKNACGTFALIHAIAQNRNRINLGDGIFAKWLAKAEECSVEERSDILAGDKQFAEAHAKCAVSGATTVSEADKNPDSHYICYVNIANRLYEFDSRMKFPRDCSPTTSDTLLKDAAEECKKLINSVEGINFSAVALVGNNN